jgi:hypothetical protein
MINIRAIWNTSSPDSAPLAEAESSLLDIEHRIVNATDTYNQLAQIFSDKDYVIELSSLIRSARNDLVGGCEMARAGYIKQAYSLWRSWFEQSIFFLYFLEAPIHKAAWQVKEQVNHDDNPQYRLMLHQLLNNSGEKHPFALVYESRYKKLTATLKISGLPKQEQPIQKAIRVLTTLSQGVHGTYQPQSAKTPEMIHTQIEMHCKPVLSEAEKVLHSFWILFITEIVALPENIIIAFRDGNISHESIASIGLDGAEQLAKLAPFFAIAFQSPKK